MVQLSFKLPEKVRAELESEWDDQMETYPTMSDYIRSIVMRRNKAEKSQNRLDDTIQKVNPDSRRGREVSTNDDSSYDKALLPIFAHVQGKHLTMIDKEGKTKVYSIHKPSDVFQAVLSTIKFDFQ